MEVLAALEHAHEAGLVVWVDGSDVLVEGDPTPEALAAIQILKEHKGELIAYLRQYGDGQPPPLDRPPANEEELRRLIDWTADPEKFSLWLEWAMSRREH